jgi:DNA-binding protein YbaB
MAIFDKVKQGQQLLKMRQQAMELKRELEKIEHSAEHGDLKVKVNGAQEVTYIEINGESRDDLVKLINEATKSVQKEAAKKMMDMGGGLSGLLGGLGQ